MASYSNENQAIVASSKRNTAYLLPLNKAPPVLANDEELTINSSIHFSVLNIHPLADNNGNKLITKSSGKIIGDPTGDVFSGMFISKIVKFIAIIFGIIVDVGPRKFKGILKVYLYMDDTCYKFKLKLFFY